MIVCNECYVIISCNNYNNIKSTEGVLPGRRGLRAASRRGRTWEAETIVF